MSDLSATMKNLGQLLEGKMDFSEFEQAEDALLEQNIHSVAAAAQPAVQLLYSSFKAGVSTLVGIGETAVGPILAESSDTQATQVLNLMQAVGIPTTGPLTLAEHAVLVSLISGLKAGLDKIGIVISTNGGVTVTPTPPAAA